MAKRTRIRAWTAVKGCAFVAAVGCLARAAADPENQRAAVVLLGGVILAFGLAAAWRRRRLGGASLERLDRMSGTEFEGYVAARLGAAGWCVSFRSRGGDYGVDLTAERDGVRIAVQAKRWERNVGNAAVQEVIAGADYFSCDAGAVVTQARFTAAARKQAERARIPLALIGREDLARLSAHLDALADAARREGPDATGEGSGRLTTKSR